MYLFEYVRCCLRSICRVPIVIFYEPNIYGKVIFIIHTIYFNLNIKSSTGPYLLICPRALKIVELALNGELSKDYLKSY
jgi:hypothetical protein